MKTKNIAIGASVLLIGAFAITWAARSKFSSLANLSKKPAAVSDTLSADNVYESALLEKFRKVSVALDAGKPECLIVGVINSANHADSSDAIENLNYIYSKKGDDFYYKLGHTETINTDNICVYIDNNSRKVIISPYTAPPAAGFADSKQLLNGLQSDNYKMTHQIRGNQETISMINENHITLKEYMVSFDTSSLKPSRIFMRYSNPDQPERTDNEKVVEFRLTTLQDQSTIEKYITKPVVKKVDGRYRLENQFKGYELIQM